MKLSRAGRYCVWSSLLALATGAALLLYSASRGETALRWSLLGWLAMAVIGVAGGSWMSAVHGRPGSAFLAALVSCMLTRLAVLGLGAWAATPIGISAAWPYVVGLGAGYIPLQLFEARWFFVHQFDATR
jgi:hypothetical protein